MTTVGFIAEHIARTLAGLLTRRRAPTQQPISSHPLDRLSRRHSGHRSNPRPPCSNFIPVCSGMIQPSTHDSNNRNAVLSVARAANRLRPRVMPLRLSRVCRPGRMACALYTFLCVVLRYLSPLHESDRFVMESSEEVTSPDPSRSSLGPHGAHMGGSRRLCSSSADLSSGVSL